MKKIEFKSFIHFGNVIPINRLFRNLVDGVNELNERLKALEGAESPATANSAETVELKATDEEVAEVLAEVEDEGEIKDVDELREKAKSLGIKSWHVKGVETLTTEIEAIETESK